MRKLCLVVAVAACSPSTLGDDGGPNDAAGTGVDAFCNTTELAIDAIPPNLLVMLDRSCSMRDPVVLGGPSKWQIAVGAMNGVTATLGTDIRWGLGLFPDLIDPACRQGDASDRSVTIRIADNTAPQIANLLTAALSTADPWFPDMPCVTNIDWAMQQASLQPELDDPARDNHVMLITDGRQADCDGAGGDPGTEMIIADLYQNRGIGTFVVGFGGEVAPAQLDIFAMLGGHPRPGGPPYYYQADDAAELDTALADIARATISCSLVVTDPPADPDDIHVFLDDTIEIPRDPTHVEGWDYDPATMTLTLYGTLCERLKSGQVVDLDLVEGCPAPVID
jgi:hypothetical protein